MLLYPWMALFGLPGCLLGFVSSSESWVCIDYNFSSFDSLLIVVNGFLKVQNILLHASSINYTHTYLERTCSSTNNAQKNNTSSKQTKTTYPGVPQNDFAQSSNFKALKKASTVQEPFSKSLPGSRTHLEMSKVGLDSSRALFQSPVRQKIRKLLVLWEVPLITSR